jgi:hypothetical protein
VKFSFRKSGLIGTPTPEQQAVLDQLERGELTPEQAADALGGRAFAVEKRFEIRGAGDAERLGDLLGAGVEEAPPWPWGRMLGAAFAAAVVIGAGLWLFGGPITRSHLFTTALVAAVVFVAVSAVAGPGLGRMFPSGEAMHRIGVRAGLAACAGVLVWGIAITAGGRWGSFLPGVVVVVLGAGVLLIALLGREAFHRGRRTVRLLRRRNRLRVRG